VLSAYRSADRFRGESAVTTWLHRIVVNACLDRVRRRQARPVVPLPEVTAEPAAVEPDHDTAREVWAALERLPAEQRVPLVLLEMQGYGVADIAAMLGVAEGTVKSRCARGRARLAVLLGLLRSPEDPDSAAVESGGRDKGHRAVGNPTAVPGVGATGFRSGQGGAP
jgi:RNA polymerase sigma-70 factor (ECF subfamily)